MRSEKRSERLTAILDAAAQLFREYGVKKTSLEDVAAKAGVGKATLYHYVDGKSELFGEVVRRYHASYMEVRLQQIESEPTAIGRIRRIAETFAELHDGAMGLLGPRVGELDGHVPLKFKYLRMIREEEKELIRAALEFGVSRGEFRPLDIERTTRLIELTVKGMLREFSGGAEHGERVLYADVFVNVLLNGIKN